MKTPLRPALTLLTALLPIAAGHAQTITTESLIREMIDMRRLADFPNPAYKTVQFSSYDRSSTVPGGPKWFANADGFGGEPTPNFEAVLQKPDSQGVGEYLVCDFPGPGAIVRTWTAAINGNIRVYFDDQDKPIFDGSAHDFFAKPYDHYAQELGLDKKVFHRTFYQQNAAYCPMPFAKRCRIVWQGKITQVHFYQVQLRRYDPGADVITFNPKDLKTCENTIRDIARVLGDPQGQWSYTSSQKPLFIDATIDPGQSKTVLTIKGPQAIERLTLKVSAGNMSAGNTSTDDTDKALRQTLLHINCDDYPWAQVQSPIGDFFGAAPGINPYKSVPFTVEPDGTMTSRFVMPFAKSLTIRIDNHGRQPVIVTGSARPMDYTWNEKTSMHFRARWRVNHGLFENDKAVRDMPYLIANGAGVYVGTATFLLNPNNIPSGSGNWWGEGDEKIFVDDDARPSTFGTGSEDYFNYAWGSNDLFMFPYCSQPRADGPANRGFITNNRWHILDALPFTQRLDFYMELFPHDPTPGTSYARMAYHYAKPGLMDDHVPVTREDLRSLELPPHWQPAARSGAAGAVFFQAEDLVKDKTKIAFIEGNLWSAGKLMTWHPTAKGQELTLDIPIAEDGKYLVAVAAARTPNSGRISATLDGTPHVGGKTGVADLYEPYRTLSRLIHSKPTQMTRGSHTLVLHYEGHADKITDPVIGIDFVMVQKR